MGLKRRIDPPRSFTAEQAQQWFKLQEAFGEELTDTGLSNTLFVDQTDGEDETAERGSLTFKYATIQAALNAALEGDVIEITPGVYNESLVWPSTESVTLKGSGTLETSIQGTVVGGNTLSFAPAAPADAVQFASIKNLVLINENGDIPLFVDGTAAPAIFQTGRLTLEGVSTVSTGGTDIVLSTSGILRMLNVDADGQIVLLNVSQGIGIDIECDGLRVDYDQTADPPAGGRNAIAFSNVISTGELDVYGQAWVAFGNDCAVDSITGVLTDDATAGFGIIDYAGKVIGTGTVGITFAYTEAGVSAQGVILDHAKVLGAVSVEDAGTSTKRCTVSARQAVLEVAAAQSIVAGNLTDIDLRDSWFYQDSLYAPGTGTIDRNSHQQFLAVGEGLPVVMTIESPAPASDPSPFPNGDYVVLFEPAVWADAPVVTARDGATVTIDGAAAALAGDLWVHIARVVR